MIKKTKNDRLDLRIDSELKQILVNKAKSENRTLSNYVLTLIINSLDKTK